MPERRTRLVVAFGALVASGCSFLELDGLSVGDRGGTTSNTSSTGGAGATTSSATASSGSTSGTGGASSGGGDDPSSTVTTGEGGGGGEGGAQGPGGGGEGPGGGGTGASGGGGGGEGGAGGSGGSGGSGGATVQDCAPLDGLIARYVAEDAASGLPAGSDVTVWPAHQGLGPDLLAPVADAAPTVGDSIGGRAAIHFGVDEDGVQLFEGALDPSVLATDAEVTIAAVLQPDDGELYHQQAVHWGERANNLAGVSLGGREFNSYAFSTLGPSAASAALPDTMGDDAAVVVGFRAVAGTTRRLHVFDQGVSLVPGGQLANSPLDIEDDYFAIGSGNILGQGWKGRIAQVLVYDRALSYGARVDLQRCLGTAYDIDVVDEQKHCADGIVDAGEQGLGCGGRECAPCGVLGLGASCTASGDCRTNLCEEVPARLGGPGMQCVAVPRGVFSQHPSTFPESIVVAAYHDGTLVHAYGWTQSEVNGVAYVLGDDLLWAVSDDGALPPPRGAAGVAHDPATDRTWLYGGMSTGVLDDLWEWDGAAWSAVASAGTAPTATFSPGLGHDPERDLLVLYGGQDQLGVNVDETFFLDLSAADPWAAGSTPATLSGRAGHALAFDDDSASVLSIGGVAPTADSDDTFGFDSIWARRGPTSYPRPRIDLHALRDPVRERVVMMGGYVDVATQADAWEWIAGRWVRTVASGGPATVAGRGVFDPVRRRVVFVESGGPQRSFDYHTLGTPCDDPADCATGTSCTDGVCCASAACGGASVCNSVALPGVCAAPD